MFLVKARRVTSVKLVYEAFRVIMFPVIVYAASVPETWREQIDFTSFSVSPSMGGLDGGASDSAPM